MELRPIEFARNDYAVPMQRRFHVLRELCGRGSASKVNATGPILASDDFTIQPCKGAQEQQRELCLRLSSREVCSRGQASGFPR